MSRSVAVIGAGLAGVTTAYELATIGCRVQVFERGGSIAGQASFASSAMLAPFVPHLTEAATPAPLAWRWRRWRASRRATAAVPALVALSQLGLERTAALRQGLGVDDESTDGLLIALSDAKRLAAAEARLEDWKSLGLAVALLDADQARRREPGLNAEAALAGALAVQGGTGNARLFAQQLRNRAQRLGVRFQFHTVAKGVAAHGNAWTLRHEYMPPAEPPTTRFLDPEAAGAAAPPPGPRDERFDAIVLCNGIGAATLLGQRLPLAAQHEASVTAPLRLLEAYPDLGPRAGWLDPARGLAIARTGQRVRITGGLAITGAREKHQPDFENLHRGLQHWFPGSVLHQQVQQGKSRRAVTADGLPLLGHGGQPGLWLNLSPGGQGWGAACGAAQVLAQLIAGETPALDITALGPQRLA
ncbi:NAD(P)/FAD-dependent oxidoreductase [Roseateles cellulosilyticus]|uniref:FAD-binding oxidoreductase n=1 Tax=Pelomonas cellulosilytica TaxID=2906762 RepID=A0ABS8XR24_9BURK|nr:FAD-binding oxidoreductase [Pelomonas sp. P8]